MGLQGEDAKLAVTPLQYLLQVALLVRCDGEEDSINVAGFRALIAPSSG